MARTKMKIPVWYFDKRLNRHVVFPGHLLKTFEDGTRGWEWSDAANGQLSQYVGLLRQFGGYFDQEAHEYVGTHKIYGGGIRKRSSVRWILRDDP